MKTFELSTLFGGEILFIIFSPTSKPYSFRHHSVESVAKRFWNPNQPLNETTHAPVEADRKGDFLVDVIEILDKQVDTYVMVSLSRSMSGFIKRLVWVQNLLTDNFNRRMTK
ncbi:hypothetical protein Goshw_017139 [Gossypium schwendimanii]|uniref:MADS-box domain-containing protein n=1 Tax=Gossypium schwendimanii TaxID=34291 RepID=A0A7J9MI78_GOSSC|nr:hypothetical protein [Gossypium schwendimanii]